MLFGPGLLETAFDRTGGGGGIDLPERGAAFLDELSSAMWNDSTRQKLGLEPQVSLSAESDERSAEGPARANGKIH